jgi:hypothetical protein
VHIGKTGGADAGGSGVPGAKEHAVLLNDTLQPPVRSLVR